MNTLKTQKSTNKHIEALLKINGLFTNNTKLTNKGVKIGYVLITSVIEAKSFIKTHKLINNT